MLNISEIFQSIQGEGPNTGQPSIFLRTAGCNLNCEWCDSKYSLNVLDNLTLSVEEVVKQIRSFDCKNLVVTGGEPLLQQKLLREVLSELKDYFIEVETNGTIKSQLDEHIDQYNCSPKLESSGNKKYPLKILPNNKTWYKFVINEEEDFFSSIKFASDYKIPRERVLMMPQCRTRDECYHKSLWLVDKCNQSGYSFCPRLHIMLWDNQRER